MSRGQCLSPNFCDPRDSVPDGRLSLGCSPFTGGVPAAAASAALGGLQAFGGEAPPGFFAAWPPRLRQDTIGSSHCRGTYDSVQ